MLSRRHVDQLEVELDSAHKRIRELEADRNRLQGRDALTGLLSVRTFRAQLSVELERARRHGRAVALAVMDVDGFRALNAAHGHEAGDEVLTAVARLLFTYTRPHDLGCRAAGDEFVLLMPETDSEGAVRCFERIQLELEALETEAVSCAAASIGIASYERGQSVAELIGAATDAMDAARSAGGGRTFVAPARNEPNAGSRDVVEALALTLLERDRYTGEHSESVVEMAAAVAHRLGLDEAGVDRIRAAALLHDIGKIAIPDNILHKAAGLDEAEWDLMREHPVIGERILRAIPGLGGVAKIVRHEHERFDGAGYPDGLVGTAIPIGSRVILACDAYHAMTSDRPYRAAMSHREAIEELSAGAGSQLDPDVVGTLIGYVHGRRQSGRPF